MLVSIIIPSYKPQKYIYKCLDSISKQNLPKKEFEVIIVLNGCNEPYYSCLEYYIKSVPELNIKIYQTDQADVCIARNIGMEKARGTYFCFIDDDDYISDNYLDSLLKISNNEIVAEANTIMVEDSTNKVLSHFLTTAYLRCSSNKSDSKWSQRSFYSIVWGKLIHRDIIGKHRFNPSFKLGEDSLFMFEISKNIKKIELSSQSTIYYIRKRNNSVSRSPISFKKKFPILTKLILSYFLIWLRNPLKYNFPLFLSRIAATFFKYFISDYQ